MIFNFNRSLFFTAISKLNGFSTRGIFKRSKTRLLLFIGMVFSVITFVRMFSECIGLRELEMHRGTLRNPTAKQPQYV